MDAFQARGDEWVKGQIADEAIELHGGYEPTEFRLLIDGKIYSSDNLTPVAFYNPDDRAEWEIVNETLYRAPDGFILVGFGKGCSPWAKKRNDCNDTCPAHGFLPLSSDEAKTWLELRGRVNDYVEIFGDAGAGEASEMLRNLPDDIANRVRAAAEAEKSSIQDWLKTRITAALD